MENETMIVPLHVKPDLLHDCIKLLNDEWPRSETARMKSIEKSNPNLPISLLIVSRANGHYEVIGHAKMTRLPLDPESCWIESVVISPVNRGKGLGKKLMEGCEELAVLLGFSSATLSTHDKQEFYHKLGYKVCQPVCHYGMNLSTSQSHTLQVTKDHKASLITEKTTHPEVCGTASSDPPPPPPLPTVPKFNTNLVTHSKKVYMKKLLKK